MVFDTTYKWFSELVNISWGIMSDYSWEFYSELGLMKLLGWEKVVKARPEGDSQTV